MCPYHISHLVPVPTLNPVHSPSGGQKRKADVERDRSLATTPSSKPKTKPSPQESAPRSEKSDLSRRSSTKRSKILVPTGYEINDSISFQINRQCFILNIVWLDRKAYYSIVSLFIDRSSIPDTVIVNADNCHSYIPQNKLALLEKLQE
jgi:hypothetical protein